MNRSRTTPKNICRKETYIVDQIQSYSNNMKIYCNYFSTLYNIPDTNINCLKCFT